MWLWISIANLIGLLSGIGLMWLATVRGRRIPSLTKYVVFSIATLIIYYTAEFIVSAKTGVERSTLTTCITGVFGGEILCACLIKIFKLKEGDNE